MFDSTSMTASYALASISPLRPAFKRVSFESNSGSEAINCKAKLILEEEYPELLPEMLGFLAVKQSTGTSALSELRPWLSPNAPPQAAAARSAISPGSCDPEPEESEFGGRVSERLDSLLGAPPSHTCKF